MRWALHSAEPKTAAELAAHLIAEAQHYDATSLARDLSDSPQEQELRSLVNAQMENAITAAVDAATDLDDPEVHYRVSIYGQTDGETEPKLRRRLQISIDAVEP